MKKSDTKKGYIVLLVAIIAAIVLLDQAAKTVAQQELMGLPGRSVTFIPGFMDFTYVENTGAAFSMFSGNTAVLAVLSAVMAVVVIVILVKYSGQFRSRLFDLALCFIAGGAVGNLIDRVARGYVVDMMEFSFVDFAIFNVADCFVTFGAVMLGVFVIWFWDKAKKEKKDDGPEDNAESE